MKFKPGDIVRVSDDVDESILNYWSIQEPRQRTPNKILVADPVSNDYKLANNYWYPESVLELVEPNVEDEFPHMRAAFTTEVSQ